MNYYFKVFRQCFDFKGRTSKKEYWYFFLFNFIVSLVLEYIDGVAGWVIPDLMLGPLSLIYCLIVLIPGIAVGVRRLHDIGKSGWKFLLVLIPIVGGLLLLVWFCREGEQGPNKWGENPKL